MSIGLKTRGKQRKKTSAQHQTTGPEHLGQQRQKLLPPRHLLTRGHCNFEASEGPQEYPEYQVFSVHSPSIYRPFTKLVVKHGAYPSIDQRVGRGHLRVQNQGLFLQYLKYLLLQCR